MVKIVFSNHWPETVFEMKGHLHGCDALVTEDAPSAEFDQMLAGELPIDDYLMASDIEFPEFGRRMCRLWRRLHSGGAAILPVEPFIAERIEIHHFLQP